MLHRGRESTDGTGDGELTVPMAWLYAEYTADALLRNGRLMPPKTFHRRRVRIGGRQEAKLHRGRESTDGTGDGELTVPMAWLYAEYIADELLRSGDLMPPTSFEFRAGRDALALTVFLSDTDGELSGIRVITQLETWLSLTAYDQPWQ